MNELFGLEFQVLQVCKSSVSLAQLLAEDTEAMATCDFFLPPMQKQGHDTKTVACTWYQTKCAFREACSGIQQLVLL